MDNMIISEGKVVSDRRKLLIFLNINVSCIATFMLGTALTTVLPPIMKDLHITVNTGQWLTSGLALFLAIMTPFTAYLITRFKTKKLYCSSMLFFMVGLIICAFSTKFWVMMLGRVIQGCGNGLLNSMGQVIILTIFPPEKRGTYMGWYGLSSGVAPIVAPIIAGVLADTIGWRSIFILALVIMLISFIFALFIFDDVLPTMKRDFDFISLILSALSFGGVTLAVGNMGSYKIVSWHVLFIFIVGIVSGIIFSWRQLHIKTPFLDIRVLANKTYTIGVISTALVQMLLMGAIMIFPVYVQQLKGRSATVSGLVMLPGSLVLALICPLAGKIYDKIGIKLLFLVGSVTLILSNFSAYFINIHHSIWILSAINVFRSLAIGFVIMPIVSWAMKEIPEVKTSDATALLNSIRYIGNAVGTAIFISITTMVADIVKDTKESPEMYGINISFLIMAIISVILLVFSFMSDSESPKDKDKNGKITEISKENNNTKGNEIERNSSVVSQSDFEINIY